MTVTTVRTPPQRPELPPRDSMFRGAPASVDSEAVHVSRARGKAAAGMLRGVSLIAKGEALGHEMWIDDTTLEQVAKYASYGKHGVKSRFTHPSMSSDGMGRHLGRIHDVRVDEGRVIGDLHFAESAHSTPDGDLAEYVMSLADEDAAAAGLSIVFEHDFDAETQFLLEHGGKVANGEFDLSEWESPDPDNENNYPHVRLSKLRAADIVDEPAANPSGLFDRQALPREMDDLLCYAAGLSETKPSAGQFGVDGDRAQQFLARWLDQHGLSLSSKEEADAMSTTPIQSPEASPEATSTPQPTREEFLSELSRYTDAFGAENGNKWFTEGLSFEDALSNHCEALSEENAKLRSSLEEAEAKLADVSLGEDEPLNVPAADEAKKKTFAQYTASKN